MESNIVRLDYSPDGALRMARHGASRLREELAKIEVEIDILYHEIEDRVHRMEEIQLLRDKAKQRLYALEPLIASVEMQQLEIKDE